MTHVSRMPGHLIRRLHQISTHVFMTRTREAGFDLTPVQFAALDAIRESPGIDQAGLADAVAKDRATIGAVADRLEQKGLVSRKVNAQDKRARILALTDEGEALVAALKPLVEELQTDILPGLDETEYQLFVELAAKAARTAGSVG
ncbi:MarR family winged helix-turn-helix transcriptional regulator [Hoeflea alexandrii]|uniref:MarR family transcriptional regulator n=1 Tax=Hoeflea alexandrii TaxID=288436 RepID=A0ABT1CTF1_9HYPH|nr:MarR family transcriptional regulator [Hoeflea alexandrii]MBV6649098.1 MarR family transcriptional regulator [Hoeflea sp.]MCO6409464.1 MarR family transcriptional regulator [Hoeflea alexandrii]MCY0152492.1 MarR family transcriptional regulator [Hoeflea alexandrii]